MKSIRLFVIVAVSAFALVVVNTPAQAYSKLYHGSDYGFTYATRDDHIMVCDEEADGHGVWVDYYTNDFRMHTMVDGNGSQPPAQSPTCTRGTSPATGCANATSAAPPGRAPTGHSATETGSRARAAVDPGGTVTAGSSRSGETSAPACRHSNDQPLTDATKSPRLASSMLAYTSGSRLSTPALCASTGILASSFGSSSASPSETA